MLRPMQHRIHEYTPYKHQVKRLYLTAVRGPIPRQMSRWKARGLQMFHWRQSWLDNYTRTTETLFKATSVYTTHAYTARCYSD